MVRYLLHEIEFFRSYYGTIFPILRLRIKNEWNKNAFFLAIYSKLRERNYAVFGVIKRE